jgi:hypothetical protein
MRSWAMHLVLVLRLVSVIGPSCCCSAVLQAWLNFPPTKHRQIWGYKILFLDVLFPLDVEKIIFVDAGDDSCSGHSVLMFCRG